MSVYFGGTVVGARAVDGVVLASDRRMSYGYFVASHNVKKIYVLTDRIGVAFAGLPGDMSGLVRFLRSDLSMYEATTGRKPSVYMAAKRLSIIMYSYKMLPFYVEALIGGVDPDGTPRLYALDSLGSITEEDFAAAGSGATIAYGFLEANYRKDATVDEIERIVVDAAKVVLRRDASTGGGIDVLNLSKEGVHEKTLRLRVALEG